MKLNDVVFVNNLPTIDLHGLDRESARVLVSDFIRDNIKLKNEVIVIVHGKGSGTLKNTIHSFLRTNKNVLEFKTYYFNDGATLVALKFWQNRYFVVYYPNNKEIISTKKF